jgi:HAD superfamily phosphoserine phosphatase-like hydrolase
LDRETTARLEFPLVCFDVDGTLVDDTIFIWQTLHDHFGTDPVARKKAHDDFFSGAITYADWFHSDLVLLSRAGATRARIREVLDMLKPMEGAREALEDLRRRGHTLAIVSGSLDIVVEHLFPDVPFRHVLLNRLAFDAEGRIAGGVPTPYDVQGKADGLRELCRREGLSPSQAAFVGDNVNDLWIARAAGLAIAFNCKSDELRHSCHVEIVEKDLRAVARVLR